MERHTWDDAIKALSAVMEGFEERPEQSVFAKAVAAAIQDESILVGQAGCGVGKSLAALVPSILSGKRTVYATATKALQDQIANKDIPFLRETLFPDLEFIVLKGRNNYVCSQKLSQMDFGPVRERVEAMLAEGHDGDRASIEVPDQDWGEMSITSEECPGTSACQFGKECRFARASKKARGARVVVTNHALLAADMQAGGAVLGGITNLVIDECHEFGEFVTSSLTAKVRMRRFENVMRSAMARHTEARLELNRADHLPDYEEGLSKAITQLGDSARVMFDTLPEAGRLIYHSWFLEHHEPFESALRALWDISAPFDAWNTLTGDIPLSDLGDADKARFSNIRLFHRSVRNLADEMFSLLRDRDDVLARWVEEPGLSKNKTPIIVAAPLDIARRLQVGLWPRAKSAILMSATVLVDEKPDYIMGELGLAEIRDAGDREVGWIDVGTPFDFPRAAALYVPNIVSPKAKDQWTMEVCEQIVQLVERSQGRALLLFTSISQMKFVYGKVRSRIKYPCMMQGDRPLGALVQWFRDETHSVLFGTRSLFTGIDVQGESLSLVVIDKLPFPVPTEPMFQARSENMARMGRDSFIGLSVPMMTLPLQQAFGRLIRTKTDTGVVAVLDSRLSSTGYGKVIVRSMPPATFTQDINHAAGWFRPTLVDKVS